MWTRLFDPPTGPSWRSVPAPVTNYAAPIPPTEIGPAYAVSCSFSYADEVNHKKTGTYPADAVISLRELLRFDFLVFLCFLYDPESAEPVRQVAFANELLGIHLTTQQFFGFREENSLDPELLTKVPDSLKYFVKDDLSPNSRRTSTGVSISRFIVNTFRDVGIAYIAYGGISETEAGKLNDYMNMLNDFLKAYDLYYAEDPLRKGVKGQADYGLPRPPKPTPDATVDMTKAASYFVDAPVDTGTAGNGGIKETGIDLPKKKHKNMSGDGDMSSGKDAEPMGRLEKRRAMTPGPVQSSLDDLLDELNHLIGLEGVKKNLNNLINVIRIRKIRTEMGLAQPDMSLHLVFSGNPGTGKTTVARLLAKIYKALGVVSKGQLVEVDRAGLVEGYVGQTAAKTQEVIDSAMGGILFIDEAYTLTNNKESGDFGQEAVDTLLKRMEDDRDSFVVIVAGYTEPMEEFLQSNPGLRSRFNKFIEFDDYSEDELFTIFESMCSDQDFHLTEEAEKKVKEHFHRLEENKEEHFANGREVRNFFERCIERQANRLVNETDLDLEGVTTFTEADVTEGQ